MPEAIPEAGELRKPFLLAYGLGLALCVAWPLILLGLIGRLLQPGLLGAMELARDLGYTFTGLVVLSALYVARRSKRMRQGFTQVEATKRSRVVAMETLLYSALFALSALFGLIYLALGGPEAIRYARTFVALSPIMFLLFVPRLSAWRSALLPPA